MAPTVPAIPDAATELSVKRPSGSRRRRVRLASNHAGPDRAPRPVGRAGVGHGSNLQADHRRRAPDGALPAEVVAVISDRGDAHALTRPPSAGIPAVHVGRHAGEARADYDARLADVVAGFGPDFVVLAGWMRVLTMSFLGWFPNRVVNLHPALPGELPGTHAIERAWHEALAGERTATGVMVHLVPDEGVDDGPVLAHGRCRSAPTTRSTPLAARVHARRARAARRHPRHPLPTGGPTNDDPQRRAVRPLRGPDVRRRRHRPRLLRDAARHRRHGGHVRRRHHASPSRSCRRRWTRSPSRGWRSPWPATAASA